MIIISVISFAIQGKFRRPSYSKWLVVSVVCIERNQLA